MVFIFEKYFVEFTKENCSVNILKKCVLVFVENLISVFKINGDLNKNK